MNRDRFFDMRKPREPRHAAAALQYDPVNTKAPEVVAVGRGVIADEIMKIAKQNKIPIHADKGLVEALTQLEVGAIIPRELYIVVAEVLSWVYLLDASGPADPKNATPH
jgi:flagellar biosynthesis protein